MNRKQSPEEVLESTFDEIEKRFVEATQGIEGDLSPLREKMKNEIDRRDKRIVELEKENQSLQKLNRGLSNVLAALKRPAVAAFGLTRSALDVLKPDVQRSNTSHKR